MAQKYTGNYTKEAAKVIRQSERLECQVTKDGTIYICNGFLIFKMNPMEYASLVQPVTCCDAGNWRIDSAGKKAGTIDAEKIFNQNVLDAKSAATMEACPMVFNLERGREIVGFYNQSADFTAIYNRSFISAIHNGAEFRVVNALSTAVAYSSGEPFAMILPIRPVPNICRAVKAYFTETENAAGSKDAEDLRAELSARESELSAMRDQLNRQAAELERIQEAQQKQSETVWDIAARFSGIAGITATVKGAQTASPVIWLSGDTESHHDEIKSAGAKWSAKRGAYYYRVA